MNTKPVSSTLNVANKLCYLITPLFVYTKVMKQSWPMSGTLYWIIPEFSEATGYNKNLSKTCSKQNICP